MEVSTNTTSSQIFTFIHLTMVILELTEMYTGHTIMQEHGLLAMIGYGKPLSGKTE